MSLKKINIFIGSSIDELKPERDELMRFIQGLNNKYVDRGYFFHGHVCEETPNMMREDGSQATHDEFIRDKADAAIFLFFHRAGEFTMHELRLARETFLAGKKPNVFVFFKAVDNAPDTCEEIRRCVDVVFNDFGHYYKMFADVDTVKLELLQFITDALPFGELVIKDGKVYLNNEAIEDIAAMNVFAYRNSPGLKKLGERITELTAAMAEASEKGDDSEALRISMQLTEAKKAYNTLEKDILDTLLYFYRENKKGSKADPRRMQALQLLERGEIEAAKELIPLEELERRSEIFDAHAELLGEQLKDEGREFVEDTRIRIQALKSDVENPNRNAEIRRLYELANAAAEKAGEQGRRHLFEQANFLYYIKDYPAGIRVVEQLHWLCSKPGMNECDNNLALLMNLLGLLYSSNNDLAKAEAAYLEALGLFQRIFAEEGGSDNEAAIATTYNNLAILYKDTGRPAEAEKLYNESLEIRRRLADTVSRETYEPDVALSSCNLANLYSAIGRPAEAEKLYLEALDIRRRLAETVSREAYEPDVAITCYNLANLYTDICRYTEAEKLYYEALEIYRRLAETVSREAYEPYFASTCNSLATLYDETERPEKAQGLLLDALKILRRLTETVSREAYEPDVAMTCNNLAESYRKVGRHAEAEKLYLESLEIRRRLAETVSREAYEPRIVFACNNLGNLYSDTGRPAEAEKLYLEALGISRRLALTISNKAYEPSVARVCYNLAKLYSETGKPSDAEKLYLEALEIRRRLSETVNREAFEPDIAATLFNLALLKRRNGDAVSAEKYFAEALDIAKRYMDVNPLCRQIVQRLS